MADGLCQSCKNWKGCIGQWFKVGPKDEDDIEWYSWDDIRWCPQQIMWLLDNSYTLHHGEWPTEPGKDDNRSGGKQISHEASFTKPEIAIAEVEVEERIGRTGLQGELLKSQVESGKTIGELHPAAHEALIYISGWRRRKQSFRDWKRQRKYRKVNTNKYSGKDNEAAK